MREMKRYDAASFAIDHTITILLRPNDHQMGAFQLKFCMKQEVINCNFNPISPLVRIAENAACPGVSKNVMGSLSGMGTASKERRRNHTYHR